MGLFSKGLSEKGKGGNREQTKFTISRDFRVMEKVDEKWKIVSASSFWDYKNLVEITADE